VFELIAMFSGLSQWSHWVEQLFGGADTLIHIACSYEVGGDTNKAISFYEQVTAYEQHPKYWDATEAIRRLKGQS